jgi:hypothetical protein
VELLAVERHRHPADGRLGLHLVEDARLADSPLGLQPNAVPVENAPQASDELVTAEDVLKGQLSTRGGFH